MAVLRIQENIKKEDGTYDIVHKETEASLVLFDKTEVKQEPTEGDYIPIIDAADDEQMKKFPAGWLLESGLQGPKGDPGDPGPQGKDGSPGKDAKINGQNTVTVEAGDNVSISQNGSTLTISATGGGGPDAVTVPGGGAFSMGPSIGSGPYVIECTADEDVAAAGSVNGILPDADGDIHLGPGDMGAESRRNLLDNWYFVGGGSQQGGRQFPINQRGLTEYTETGYTIDRWFLYAAVKMQLESSGVTLIKTSSNGQLIQRLPMKSIVPGAVVSFSLLLANGELYHVSGKAQENFSQGILLGTNFGWIGFRNLPGNDFWEAVIHLENLSSVTLVAAKLELGSAQTLVRKDANGNWVLNDPPPKYGKALNECQRYQIISDNNLYAPYLSTSAGSRYCLLPLPTTPREVTPSIIGNPVVCSVATDLPISGASIISRFMSINGVVLRVSGGTEPCYVNFPTVSGLDFNL